MMFREIDRDQYAVPKLTDLEAQKPPPRGPMDTKKNIEQTRYGFIAVNQGQVSNHSPIAPRYINVENSNTR